MQTAKDGVRDAGGNPDTEKLDSTVPEPIPVATTTLVYGPADVQAEPAGAPKAPLEFERAAPGTLDRRYVTAALMIVMVLASMEQTVTSTAMPTIIGELHGLEHYAWVASIYLLACTVAMPLYGRLADVLGRKRVILFSISLFAVSSMLAASAHTMGQLILFRGLQGLGAGGIMPVVLTILGDIFTLKERASIQGLFSAIWGTSSLAGPALGAFLVNTLGWRSIFFVNLPFGALGFAVLWWKYHDQEKAHSTDLDLPGIGALALFCTATLTLVSGIGPQGWDWPVIGGLLGLAVGAMIFFIRHERRAANPVLPPALVMNRSIGPSLAGSLLMGVGFLSLDTFVPLYVQGGLGGGATAAASVVTPVMLTWAISGTLAAPLVIKWGFRKTSLLGCAIIATGFTGLLIGALCHAPHWVLTMVLALTGFGFGPTSMGYLLAAQGAVAWQQRGIVTSAVQFFRTIGGAIGIGLLGALFNVLIGPKLETLASRGVSAAALLDPHSHAKLPADVVAMARHMIAGSLIWVFAAMVFFALVGVVVTSFMARGKAEHVSRSEALEAMAG